MQRGILHLTKEEAKLLLQRVSFSVQDISKVAMRLTMAANADQPESTIQVNREEVEALLDILPIPSQENNQQYQVIRSKLTAFLLKKNE
jgi:uncharacterized lipoprotein YehR (DUF1307 family)